MTATRTSTAALRFLQQYEYLRQALTAYHNGSRRNPLMSAMVQPLTPSEIDDLAWYYSRQHGLTTKY
jgi:cytochrome c553